MDAPVSKTVSGKALKSKDFTKASKAFGTRRAIFTIKPLAEPAESAPEETVEDEEVKREGEEVKRDEDWVDVTPAASSEALIDLEVPNEVAETTIPTPSSSIESVDDVEDLPVAGPSGSSSSSGDAFSPLLEAVMPEEEVVAPASSGDSAPMTRTERRKRERQEAKKAARAPNTSNAAHNLSQQTRTFLNDMANRQGSSSVSQPVRGKDSSIQKLSTQAFGAATTERFKEVSKDIFETASGSVGSGETLTPMEKDIQTLRNASAMIPSRGQGLMPVQRALEALKTEMSPEGYEIAVAAFPNRGAVTQKRFKQIMMSVVTGMDSKKGKK